MQPARNCLCERPREPKHLKESGLAGTLALPCVARLVRGSTAAWQRGSRERTFGTSQGRAGRRQLFPRLVEAAAQ